MLPYSFVKWMLVESPKRSRISSECFRLEVGESGKNGREKSGGGRTRRRISGVGMEETRGNDEHR